MRTSLFLISLLLSSTACSQADEYREDVGVADAQTSATPAPAATKAKPGAIKEETERYTFEYSWPAQAATYPGLVDHLRKQAKKMKAIVREEADRSWSELENSDLPLRQHSSDLTWTVVADLPDWLSLAGDLATYSGGAHGMYGKESLVWNKEDGKAYKGIELFVSPYALERALGVDLCNALNAERSDRRGEPVDPESDDMFDECPAVDEATVLVGSSNGQTFDRIGVYFGPYVAGPYAEGDYELNFPVTGAVLDAVKPKFAKWFSIKR